MAARIPRFLRGFPQVTAPYVRRLSLNAAQAVAAAAAGVHAAVTDTGEEVVVTTAITNPPYPRNITATAGGTAGDIGAIQVTIDGLDAGGNAITEDLPAFTVDTAGIVAGALAFASVTSITIPAHDGTGATTAIGFGDIIGLPERLPANTVLFAAKDGVREATPPTVVVDATDLKANTVDLSSALDGDPIDIWYIASP
jgi:hypothetical protein